MVVSVMLRFTFYVLRVHGHTLRSPRRALLGRRRLHRRPGIPAGGRDSDPVLYPVWRFDMHQRATYAEAWRARSTPQRLGACGRDWPREPRRNAAVVPGLRDRHAGD